MKILSIGNSFSEDAQRYLAKIADNMGLDAKCVNMCIGGCTLERHYKNMLSGEADYLLQINGKSISDGHSFEEILSLEEWDVITLQEASVRSVNVDNYLPYIVKIADFLRKRCPDAKIAIHQTWGYESGIERIRNLGFESQKEMFSKVKTAVLGAFDAAKLDFIIPSGEVMQSLADMGYKVHRDGFHASRGIGRYALSLCWIESIFGVSTVANGFSDFEEEITAEDIATVEKVVHDMVINAK